MSNKTLAYVLIVVVVVLAGGFVWWRISANKTVQSPAPESQQAAPEQNTSTNNTVDSMNNSPANNNPACQRNFSQDTLKNAKVDIKNRQVEIDVKDFGKIVVELYDQDAPKTVENFLRLVNSGYYDCVTFHRVSKGFVIQGGDPTGTGSGGDSAFGGKFADEINPNSVIYQIHSGSTTTPGYAKGILAMANSGPNTNTSQFFIMLGDIPTQPGGFEPNYTIFGKVSSGQDVVDKIGQVDVNPGPFGPNDGSPKAPVVMQSVKIVK